jgi:hypothetical protein
MSSRPWRVEAVKEKKPTAKAAAAPRRVSERFRIPRHARNKAIASDAVSCSAGRMPNEQEDREILVGGK